MKVREIYQLLDRLAPFTTAYDFDNVGLVVGNPETEVQTILLALDPTHEVVTQAIAQQASLIITHHPLHIEPVKTVTCDKAPGDIMFRLIQNNISLIAMHTNLDLAAGGVNDALADLLGLQNIRTVSEKTLSNNVKLTVFVPTGHTQKLRSALEALRLQIFPNYESCSFTCSGVGRFKPVHAATPFVGQLDTTAQVAEDRIELLLPRHQQSAVLAAIKAAHPYEQPAFEFSNIELPQAESGLLRIGELPEPLSVRSWAEKLNTLGMATMLFTLPKKIVRTVCVCGGSAMEFWPQAQAAGADIFVTGDIKYHSVKDAADSNLAVIALGHQDSELPILPVLQTALQSLLPTITIVQAKESRVLYALT